MAEAFAIVKIHGAGCYVYLAERIGALALAHDVAGICGWQEIAACIQDMHAGATH